jgi:hypothetical protein
LLSIQGLTQDFSAACKTAIYRMGDVLPLYPQPVFDTERIFGDFVFFRGRNLFWTHFPENDIEHNNQQQATGG